jgi:hypothetical protein
MRFSGARQASPPRADAVSRTDVSGPRMTRTAGRVQVSSDFSGAADDQPTPASRTCSGGLLVMRHAQIWH